MPFEAMRSRNHGGRDFRVRRDLATPTETRHQNPAAWYQGVISAPAPEKGIHAVFNGPLVAVNGELVHVSRAMDTPQRPGIADRTAFFDVSVLQPAGILHLPPIPTTAITGKDFADYGVEDIRMAMVGPGELACGATAELGGVPYAARFSMHLTTRGVKVEPMELLGGVDAGKNDLPWGKDFILHRLESSDDTIIVLKRKSRTNTWDIVDRIVFPYITAHNEAASNNGGGKKRVGLTNGERIPMPNGNFRLIIHEVTNSGQGYGTLGNIAEYQFRLAEFTEDHRGIPQLVATDPQPLLTYPQVIALAGPGNEPDPTKRVIYSVGGAFINKELFFPVTVRDREEHLFVIPLVALQRPFAPESRITSQRKGLHV